MKPLDGRWIGLAANVLRRKSSSSIDEPGFFSAASALTASSAFLHSMDSLAASNTSSNETSSADELASG
jgi:hypothetical protein